MGTLNTEKIFQLPSERKALSVSFSSEPGSAHGSTDTGLWWHPRAKDSPLPRKLLTQLTPATHTVTVPSSSQGSAEALDYWKDKQLHLGQQPHL